MSGDPPNSDIGKFSICFDFPDNPAKATFAHHNHIYYTHMITAQGKRSFFGRGWGYLTPPPSTPHGARAGCLSARSHHDLELLLLVICRHKPLHELVMLGNILLAHVKGGRHWGRRHLARMGVFDCIILLNIYSKTSIRRISA